MRTAYFSVVGALGAACLAASPVSASVVTDWNAAALDGLPHSKTRFFAPRVMAMMAVVLERSFPDRPAFKFAVPDRGERAFCDFRQFAEEEAESRIIGGLHFRWSTVAGSALGESVAKIALKSFATTPRAASTANP